VTLLATHQLRASAILRQRTACPDAIRRAGERAAGKGSHELAALAIQQEESLLEHVAE
jgi:hypothetical protein